MTRVRTPDPLARRRLLPGGALSALLGAALVALPAAQSPAQQPFDVALRDGLLSIRANDAPAGALAEALSGETGVTFVVTGDVGRGITTEIVDEPFDKAVAKLSPNHLLVRDGNGADAAVIEVVLMLDEAAAAAGGDGGEGFLPSGAPADGIVSEEPPAEGLEPSPEQLDGLSVDGRPTVVSSEQQFDDGQQPLAPDGGLPAEGELPPEGQPLAQ